MNKFETMTLAVQAAEEDWRKAQEGNKAAAVRVRKHMQEIKAIANQIRIKALALTKKE